MARHFELPDEMQETHEPYARIDADAPPDILGAWLTMFTSKNVHVVKAQYGGEYLALRLQKQEKDNG